MIQKNQIINNIAKQLDMKPQVVRKIVDVFLMTVAYLLKTNNEVAIKPLGRFNVIKTKPRKGFNMWKNEVIDIPEKKKIKYKMSSYIKKDLNRQPIEQQDYEQTS